MNSKGLEVVVKQRDLAARVHSSLKMVLQIGYTGFQHIWLFMELGLYVKNVSEATFEYRIQVWSPCYMKDINQSGKSPEKSGCCQDWRG